MMSRKFIVLLATLVLASADVYLHMPRGSNNRLNEASAERNNGDRLMDTQNNNRGGYNVGDKTRFAAPSGLPARNPAISFDYTDTLTPMQYPFVYIEGSTLRAEWASQHGCGGNEATDPHKMNCNMLMQYMCDTQPNSNVAPTLEMQVGLRDGGNTNTPNEPNSYADILTGATALQNAANQNGRHESEAWYYMCKRRVRNRGLFHADQNINGATSRYTRQNNNGNRRGLECPEERDYYPYWNPSPWIDIAYLTSNPEHCPMVWAGSQNNNSVGWCDGALPFAGDNYDNSVPITEEDCVRIAGETGLPLVWRTINKGLPGPECRQAEWGRVNHLGHGRHGDYHHYDWKIPSFDMLASKGYATIDTNFLRCVFRLRYNISTDDYDPWTANSTMDDNELMGIISPIRQNPTVDIGAHDLTGLRLALNTNQFGRTFQDRSHVFYIMKRPAALASAAEIYNLNVRGKRGNIVQTYPSVQYDFVPTNLQVNVDDLVHIQWTGSNTHNNGNPAGDGQSGDAGEGTGGSDRHNFVIMGDISENYPLPLDKFGTNDISLFKHTRCWTLTGTQISNWQDCALILATSGQYRNMAALNNDPMNFDPLLNEAPPSLIGGLLMSFQPTASGKTFNYMCTRNNNFASRVQKGTIIVS